MRIRTCLATIIAAVAVASAAAAQEPPDTPKGTGAITGRVTAGDTGRPIPGATVSTISWDSMRVPKIARTDADGRYELTGLPAGRFEFSVAASGYLAWQLGSPLSDGLPPVDLEDGARVKAADVVMYRPGAIEGVLLDEFGDPAPNVSVQVAQLQFAAGRRRLMPVGGGAARLTDDRGHFRVTGLAPGSYFVLALTGAFAGPADAGGAADTEGPAWFAQTYYPGTADVGAAQRIAVKRGETADGVGFSLVPARTVGVSGTVVDGDGLPAARSSVLLSVRDSLGSVEFLTARTAGGADGRFTFRNLSPGVYTIQAWGGPITQAGNLNSSEFGWLPLNVAGSEVTGLVVRTSRNAAARGRVVFEEGSVPPVPFRQVRVAGRPVELDSAPMGGGPNPTTMNEDGTFEILNLSGRWVIRPDVTSPDWTLKHVTLGGKDVTDAPIDFKDKDVEGLEVVLTTRNPSIGGAVLDDRGRAIGNFSVIVFAADSRRWTYPSRFVALGRPSQQGQYKIGGLPPEDYLVVALPPITGGEWQDPEFLESLRPLAQPVTLVEGDAKSIDLRLKR